jgi:proteasome lid subunit RPN8/RPN11
MTARLSDLEGLRHVAADVVYPHVFENADREVGGVLVGSIPPEGGAPVLTGAIPALRADERRATLTFTQDAWEHVHRTLDARFPPHTQIIGWYHSHPGFGIFLSEHDLFIHRNFFGGLSQIALVVDPHGCSEGVFAWRAGEVELLFERPTPDGWQASAPPVPGPAPEAPAASAARIPALALVLAVVLGLGVGYAAERVLVGGGAEGVRTITSPPPAATGATAPTAPRTSPEGSPP